MQENKNTQLVLPFERAKDKIVEFSFNKNYPKFFANNGLLPTEVYNYFWFFAFERQNIFFRRFFNDPPPWTQDPILIKYKFTNAYRASDRVSQYLIKNVIYYGDQSYEELFFRIILFKIFNKIETWKLLEREFTSINLRNFSFINFDQILTNEIKEGRPIFSAAYIMPTGKNNNLYKFKHQFFLDLLRNMIDDEIPQKIHNSNSLREVFNILRSYPFIGNFLAYQYTIDLNYSNLINFSESEFVIPGPGAKNGIKKCFNNSKGIDDTKIINLITDLQDEEFKRLGLDFKTLWGRKLQLIDCQNLFCEIDKYSRVAFPKISGKTKKTRIKQVYKRTNKKIDYWFPPKWGINQYIEK
ncbi:MAG: hypothetical protein PWQ55_2012 [Chloroflexota bacterium]|nr:hypothetical protein [Chloroflexota bacterium]